MSKKTKQNNTDTFFYEKKFADAGYDTIAGIDEAGRGPLAGPVVAGAVIVVDADFDERIDDSKKLTERMRERAFIEILNKCIVGIGSVSVEEVDRLNIFNATLLAMKKAVEDLDRKPNYLLIDGRMNVHLAQPRTCLIRGESKSLSIACASIAAKVFRDRVMIDEDKRYPAYGFKQHKGYGTKKHMEAIRIHGLSPIHRTTFGPFGDSKKKKKRGPYEL
ncbi:MAG: ribonuclease HII [Candidatus Omnitrophica bacterium]|nr:ribonuclease HII [Candidatus Omnitrophota bacterium]